MPAKYTKLGPGTITVGEVGTELDWSCQLVNAQVEWDKDQDDDIIVLCDDTIPGSTTYSATFTGTVVQDIADSSGIVFFSWNNRGTAVPFTFTPNSAAGTQVVGVLTIDPITVGGDEARAVMQSDFTWNCVGEPDLVEGTPTPAAADVDDREALAL